MKPVGYEDLDEKVQDMIAELQIKVMDLEGEAKLWRAASLIAFMVFAERLWKWLL